MKVRARETAVPLYLLACIVLGGSAQAIWGNMVLQICGAAIIAWAFIRRRVGNDLTRGARHMLWIGGAGLAIALLQLVPLPASLWSIAGGREEIAQGYRTLGLDLPVRPLSLDPYAGIDTLLMIIPAFAVFAGVVMLKAYRAAYVAAALIAGTCAAILLSALQVSSARVEGSPFYLYPITNVGVGVGFFANANHMASLLLITVPFLAALVPAAQKSHVRRYSAFVAIAASLALLVLIGLGLNGSLAGLGLALPIALASVAIILPRGHRAVRWIGTAALGSLALGIAVIAWTGIGSATPGQGASESVNSRADILGPTVAATMDHLPFGTGVGTFLNVYPLYEDPYRVTTTYVIHAHNDYLEWLMEMGIPGLVVLLAFLLWWGRAAIGVWRSPEAASFVRAAVVASAALLAHSLVDYPLRTGALSACFGFFIALIADWRPPQASHAEDLRPTRHLVYR